MSVVDFPESERKRNERLALGLTKKSVLCECPGCGARTHSQVNRNGYGDACRACKKDDLRAVDSDDEAIR